MEVSIDDVRIVEVSRQLLVAARGTAGGAELPSTIRKLLHQVWSHLQRHGVSNTGQNVVLYTENSTNIEAGVEVSEDVPASRGVRMSHTPAGRAAMTTYWGPYVGLPRVHEAVRRWCEQNGHKLAGRCWEVYGDWSDDPAKLRTDVFYLLKHTGRESGAGD